MKFKTQNGPIGCSVCAAAYGTLTLAGGTLLLACCAPLAGAQNAPASSTLPPTAPTSMGQGNMAPIAGTPLSASGPVTHARQAQVFYQDGLLDVRANNSSLNQILRAVAQATGMKITGGVPEQRVFGNYGPAQPATVLATLLDGTGSNMLLRETATDAPAELVLTPRTGGVTPPDPFASANEDNDRAESAPNSPPPQTVAPNRLQAPGQLGPRSIPQPQNNVNGSPANSSPTASTLPVTNSVPTDAVATPSTTPATNGIVDAPNPPPANPGVSNSSGTSPTGTDSSGANTTGVKTPQQIYEQLQQLMKQGQNQTGSTQTNPNTQTAPNSTTTPTTPNPQ